jgi:hypothetical protein
MESPSTVPGKEGLITVSQKDSPRLERLNFVFPALTQALHSTGP